MTRKSSWVAVAIASLVVIVLIGWMAGAWTDFGDAGMSAAGWFALGLGVLVTLALGATAGLALFGKAFRVTRDRGRLIPSRLAPYALATVHPSSLLRAPDEETRHREIDRFVADLKTIAEVLRKS